MFSCVLGVQIKMEQPYAIQAKTMLPSQVSEQSVWDSVILSFQSIEGANEFQSTHQMFILYLIDFFIFDTMAYQRLLKHPISFPLFKVSEP